MANDVEITAGSGTPIATDETSGRHYQLVKLVGGAEDSEARIGGDATYGMDVDVTRLPSLPAGANVIGGIRLHGRAVTTRYWFHSGALVVTAAADGANVGRVYVENDPDSTVILAIPRIRFTSQLGSALATPTSPRIVIRSFTFTGDTPSGAAITGVKQDTSLASKNGNWNVRTAATGMVITEAGDVCSFFPSAGATAVAYSPATVDRWESLSDPIILRAGQGLMVKQADAGTTSDTRRFTVDFEIEECSAV